MKVVIQDAAPIVGPGKNGITQLDLDEVRASGVNPLPVEIVSRTAHLARLGCLGAVVMMLLALKWIRAQNLGPFLREASDIDH